MGKGRCKACDYVWTWPGSSSEAPQAACPNCTGPLSRTTKPVQTECTRAQLGLPVTA
jgi:uncharacterized paraquat-inducible protein A